MSELPDARAVTMAGHTGDVATARSGIESADPRARLAAVGALHRLGALDPEWLHSMLCDDDEAVVARSLEIAGSVPSPDTAIGRRILAVLQGPNPYLTEIAAWALGERHGHSANEQAEDEQVINEQVGAGSETIGALSAVATDHADALCREAAVAALGSIGDPTGRSAVLAATHDKATVRRRAVLALAAFEGADVDEALELARHDRDWQVRQAAEDLA